MKNFTRILVAGAMAMPVLASAQVNVGTSPTNRNAVIEEWTGIHCGYCPTGHAAVQQAVLNNPGRVVAVNIHSGSYAVPSGNEPDYRTPQGTVHDNAFPITGYPSSTLNRRTIGGSQVYHPANSNNSDKVPAVLGEVSEVNIYGEATLDIVTRQLNVSVEYYYTANAPSSTNYMNVAILQNNVHGPQTTYGGGSYNPGGWISYPTVYNHMHMFRGFMTGQWGDPINTTTSGSTDIMNYSQVLPTDINGVDLDVAEIELGVYIGDGFESAGNVLTGIVVHPTLTGFTSSNEVIFMSADMNDVMTCDLTATQTMSPELTLRNWGSSPMASATITYDVNGGTPVVYNWSDAGNPIAPGATRTITLDPISFVPNAGNNTLNVSIANPNGVADNTADNSGTKTFTATGSTEATTMVVTMQLVTDRYGSETTWDVKNSGGQTIANGGPYGPDLSANGTTTQAPVYITLSANECYTFTIHDSYGDGIDAGYGAGSYSIKDGNNNTLVSGGDFGSSESGLFKTGSNLEDNTGISEITFESLSIYPNPASEVLNVEFNTESEEVSVSILDLSGRVIATENGSTSVSFQVGELASGSYLVRISTEAGSFTQNVVID